MRAPLVLSLFPGADLLGRGFEAEGYCVVRGPEKILGGDVRDFHAPAGHFAGVIGGPPCQDFSSANRNGATGEGLELIAEFVRVVIEAEPEWFLMENVPSVPDLAGLMWREGLFRDIQRFSVNPREFGLPQNRWRSFQFGSRDGAGVVVRRGVTGEDALPLGFTSAKADTRKVPFTRAARAVLATEGRRKGRRTFDDVCDLQGLPRGLEFPGLTKAGKYSVVGNGSVPVSLARVIARAITERQETRWQRVCVCQCGQPVREGTTLFDAACRKRMERRRSFFRASQPAELPGVTHRGAAAVAGSLFP